MARGFAAYIMEEWREIEQEFLLDAYLKLNCKDDSDACDLFEKDFIKE